MRASSSERKILSPLIRFAEDEFGFSVEFGREPYTGPVIGLNRKEIVHKMILRASDEGNFHCRTESILHELCHALTVPMKNLKEYNLGLDDSVNKRDLEDRALLLENIVYCEVCVAPPRIFGHPFYGNAVRLIYDQRFQKFPDDSRRKRNWRQARFRAGTRLPGLIKAFEEVVLGQEELFDFTLQ